MGDVAVVSANYGRWDTVRPQTAQDVDVEWVLFTDDPALEAPPPWRVVVEGGNGVHPCLAAKKFKLLPPVPHRYVIWIDANVEVTSPTFVREALACIHDGIAVHPHPFRDCIYDEALECSHPKYYGQPIDEQIAHYREQGHPEHAGLYACGTIAWDREHSKARQLGSDWLAECATWTFQDQLSCPVLMRRLGITPGLFPHPQYESPWLAIHDHNVK